MTTGATGQLGLALPVQGELSGTWGDTVNNGITQYTNIAIAGTLTLTGDGAVTLANTTGDASASNITSTLAGAGTVTAQFAIVKVSGTTTTKVVTGPSYSKTYVVDNASSFAVTFKASGQTGVSIAAAEKVTVVFNGTDYIKLAGTIANAAGSNTQIQFNNGGLFGASSNLTWDGTTLSSTQVNITGQGTLRLQDTTGGEYVGLRAPASLGASYTLTWPADDGILGQALITDGSGALSWSTSASGDVYGPGSSTDNAVARFDSTTGKLLQNSVVIIGDTGDVSGVGTLSATTLTLTNALGTAYGGTGLTSFTSGGVVYASSSSALATGSGLTYSGSTLTAVNNSNTLSLVLSRTDATARNWALGVDGDGAFGLRDLGSGGVVILTGGAAGITTLNSASELVFKSSNTEGMRLTSTGLGIGTSSPVSKLDVAETATIKRITSGNTMDLNFYNGSGSGTAGNVARIRADGDGVSNDYGALSFWTGRINTASITEKMRLDSAGNLGLGVTPSAWGSGSKGFQVLKGGLWHDNSQYFSLVNNAYYDGTNWKYISTAASSQIAQINGESRFYNASAGTAGNNVTFTQAMTLDASGNLLLGTTSNVASSRRELVMVAANGALVSLGNTTTADRFQIASDSSENALLINKANMPMIFYTNNTERMRIDSSGNVGIGTTSATQKLEVSGGAAQFNGGNINGVVGDAILFGNTTYPTVQKNRIRSSISAGAQGNILSFETSTGTTGSYNDSQFTLLGDGNVGIGTGSPSVKLEVVAGTGSQALTVFRTGDATAANNAGGGFSATSSATAGSRTARMWLDADGANFSGSDYFYIDKVGNSGEVALIQQSNAAMTFQTSGTERARIDSSGNLLVGATNSTPAESNVSGASIASNGGMQLSRAGAAGLKVNRGTDDGELVAFLQAGTQEGNITVSGTTVSYNGGHLSRYAQTTTAKDNSLVKGTVLSNLDEMNVYTKDGQPVDNEQLNKVKVSDTEGDVNVAGVFVNWSHDEDHNVDEINMAMTGDMIIRIAQGVTVVRGDLLMSAGDGTAKPQGDDIIRSKTVAKVTSNHVTCTYADGSYCVPCVLMAC